MTRQPQEYGQLQNYTQHKSDQTRPLFNFRHCTC
jgi:hypothetical protein